MISQTHRNFVEQRAAQQETQREETFHSNVQRRIEYADPDAMSSIGYTNVAGKVSLGIPGMVFDGSGSRYISVSFNLDNPLKKPQIFAGRMPGMQTQELNIDPPKNIFRIEHRLREEISLGKQVLAEFRSALARGEKIEEFSERARTHKSPDGKGFEFHLKLQAEAIREDGGSIPLTVHCDIRTDGNRTPKEFTVQIFRRETAGRHRTLAGATGFRGSGHETTIDGAEAKAQIKSALTNICPQSK